MNEKQDKDETIYFLFEIKEKKLENDIKKIWVNIFANNPADLNEDKIRKIEGAMRKVLSSKYFENDEFWEDLIKEAIKETGKKQLNKR